MHDIVFVKNLESFNKLFKNQQGSSLIKGMLFSKHSFQSSSIAVFINKVEIILGFKHIKVSDDMFVLLNICQDINFMDCAFLEFFVCQKFPDFDHLDSILFIVNFIDCSIDFAIGALSNNLIQSVVFDYPNH